MINGAGKKRDFFLNSFLDFLFMLVKPCAKPSETTSDTRQKGCAPLV